MALQCSEKKRSLDIAADIGSGESLSFSGLLCIQNQQSKSPLRGNNVTNNQKMSPEFDFGHAKTGLPPISPKNTRAHVLFISGQLHQRPIPIHPSHSQSVSQSSLQDILSVSRSSRKGSNDSFSYSNSFAAKTPTFDRKNQASKEKSAQHKGFGRKFCSTCGQCQAIEPSSVKEPMSRGSNMKPH